MGECMMGLTKILELKKKLATNVWNEQTVTFDKRYQVSVTFFTVKNVDNVWNEQTVMFDKRYQVHWTFFTVKHFEPRPSFFRGF